MVSLLASLCTLVGTLVLWGILSRRTDTNSGGLSNVRGPKREHWLTGNLHRLFKDAFDYTFQLIDEYGGVIKIYGVLGSEQLYVSDPRALYHIVAKDQDIYHETEMFLKTNQLIFGEGLISTEGDQHRKQRKMLNPVFSLANMRQLLPVIQPIANGLLAAIKGKVPEDGSVREIDVLPWIARGTIEYVGQAVLGVSFGPLDPGQPHEYIDAIRKIQHQGIKIFFLRPLVPWAVHNFSSYWRNKMIDWLPFPAAREVRRLSYIMERHSRKILNEKRMAMEQGHADPARGDLRDLMSIMLEANASTSEQERLNDIELTGQINTILLGGQETTTSALSRILYVLAREPHAQARLRSEIRDAKIAYAAAHGIESDWESVSLSYDALMSLPYLDAVVRETLRLHPPTTVINRMATKDAVLPVEFPIRSASGEEMRAVHVPAGTTIVISILGANHNKAVWGADADVWRPERWFERVGFAGGKSLDLNFGDSHEEMGLDHDTSGSRAPVKYPGVYASMMTFLGGNRACIGFKFAEMEIKQVITTLLPHLHFALPSSTDSKGIRKEIYWRIDGLQVPVVREPHGDFKTAQVPLEVRAVKEEDFMSA